MSSTSVESRRVLAIVWTGLLLSLFAYLGIAWFVLRGRIVAELSWVEWLRQPIVAGLHLAGIAMLVASFFLPGMIMRSSRPDPPTISDPLPAPSDPRISQAIIVRYALLESIAIFGFVIALVTGNLVLMLPLWVVSAVAFLLAYPSENLLATFESLADDR
ncbi:MAG TPA: hypothetical protein VMT00_13050 [Thermoanaerobaculia bacterium]|nr:hypothetical protein [Thermoanaerobaculia bacterium]